MVALKKYDRIEASGLWRASAEAQRQDVIVALGDATLTIKTVRDQVLAHWSLAAVERANPGRRPARYHPDGDPGETLEIGAEHTDMVDAIETLRKAVGRTRAHPGRLRWLGFAASSAIVAAIAVLWLPGALRDHTISVVPDVGRAQIGQDLLTRITRVTGPVCGTTQSQSSLAMLGARLGTPDLAVLRGGISTTLHIPGGRILLARQLLEDHEEPDVAAGFILAEFRYASDRDALRDVLEQAGTIATFRLLTTGKLDDQTLDAYAETLLTRDAPMIADGPLLAAFADKQVRSSPYAYALDITGQSVLSLIEADPMRGTDPAPLLRDRDWLRLQSICD